MKILVLNCGSSSIKYKLFDMTTKEILAQGGIEKIGLVGSFLKLTLPNGEKKILEKDIPEHTAGIEFILNTLVSPEYGAIKSLEEINAVGHRMVHGGERFSESVKLDKEVLDAFAACNDLAPLHNPANLKGVNAVSAILPNIPQVGVFDTAFHQTMPERAYRYALPQNLYTEHQVRRYGFHGTSHAYVTERASELAGAKNQGGWLSAHLGNGSSTCAVWNGESLDTSMGMTPLEGVVMGTRSGDVDPSLHLFLANNLGWDIQKIDNMLNKESGLLGLSGLSNDMRTLVEASEKGHEDATLAIEVFCYRLAKSLSALSCGLPHLDGLVFTGGIGENSAYVREKTLAYLPHFGLQFSKENNDTLTRGTEGRIDGGTGPQIWVIPTDEEGRIAKETRQVLAQIA